MRNPLCTKCELGTLPGRFICLPGNGDPRANIMVIGDSPDRSENSRGLPFQDSRIKDLFKGCGLDESNTYFTYAVKCMPAHEKKNKKRATTKKQRAACLDYLIAEARMVQPKITILLGADVAELFTKKKFALADLRGKFLKSPNFGTVTTTYNPKFTFVNPAFTELFHRDVRNALDFLTTGIVVTKEYGTGVVITNDRPIILSALKKASRAPFLASDLETANAQGKPDFRFWKPGFHNTHCGFCWAPNEGITFDPRVHPDLYEKFLTFPQVVHNASFEGNIYPRGTIMLADTLILSHLHNPFLPLSLEERANIHLENIRWKGGEGNAWDLWAERNAIDIDVTYRLYEELRQRVNSKAQLLQHDVILPAGIILGGVRRLGLNLDRVHQESLDEELADEALALHWRIVREFGFPSEGNLGSPQQICNFLYNKLQIPIPAKALKELGDPSTDAEILSELALRYPVCNLIRQYRTLIKLRSNYIYRDEEGRLRKRLTPNFKICGTVTGRPSSSEPNVQNFSKQNRVRKSYIPEPGHLWVSGDLKQVELVLLGARFAQDPTMNWIYRNSGDIHSETAMALMGEVTKETRSKAKPCNFLLLYGGSWQRLQASALKDYGIMLSDKEARSFKDGWFNKYRGVADYHTKVYRELLVNPIVKSPLGRVWEMSKANSRNNAEVESAWRDALNYPTQGTGSDLNLLGTVCAEELLPGCIRLAIHDQNVCSIPAEQAMDFAREFKTLWEKRIAEFYPGEVPITVEMSIGPSLGELEEVKF